ncbi:hypothetical protein SLE2022_288050 [Rubroshorea leprosula]
MDSSVSNWELLPKDILDLILDRLVYVVDYLYFAGVCKEWYLVAQEYRKRRHNIDAFHPHQLPLLLIPHEKLVCSVIHGRVSHIKSNVHLNKRCFGSSLGWLMYLDQTLSMILLNPFSNKIIKLPPIIDKEGVLVDPLSKTVVIKKGVLSKDPELYPTDFMVAIICGPMSQLAIYKSSVQSWAFLIELPRIFHDIIHHKGDFYAVDIKMRIGRIDVAGIERCSWVRMRLVSLLAQKTQLRLGLTTLPHDYRFHLVSSSDGNLLLVRGTCSRDFYKKDSFTSKFWVYKVKGLHESANLVEIKDLGDNALFLCEKFSALIPTHGIPKLQHNCIYYTNCNSEAPNPHGASIFNLTKRSVKSLQIPGDTTKSLPMVWITPAL